MPVEFIGMIGTKNESEIRLTAGPVIDPDYVRRFARAHEDAGFDRVLIGYSSARPDGSRNMSSFSLSGRAMTRSQPLSWQ